MKILRFAWPALPKPLDSDDPVLHIFRKSIVEHVWSQRLYALCLAACVYAVFFQSTILFGPFAVASCALGIVAFGLSLRADALSNAAKIASETVLGKMRKELDELRENA